jgi:hypothetical protein
MRRWGWLVAVLYGLILALLAPPVIVLCFYPDIKVSEAENWLFYTSWQVWAALALMVVAQAAMLMVPVRVAGHRPVGRRAVMLPIVLSGLLTALLLVAMAGCILEFLTREPMPEDIWPVWLALGLGLCFWTGWTAVFYRRSRSVEPVDAVTNQARWLKRTSILTLLVAVPTHVIARQRNYCCAGMSTFWGIACGLAVLLFAFGPGAFMLYVARWRQIRPGQRIREVR